jgi:hypothetical protein
MRVVNRVMTVLACTTGVLFGTGCGAALRVRQGKNAIDGLPFYVKEAKCVHQQVLVMPYYRVTLQTMQGDKVTGAQTATVSESYYLTDPTVAQLSDLVSGTADVSSMTTEDQQRTVGNDWTAIKKQGANDVYAKAADGSWPVYVVANSSAPKVYVDYGTVYYINGKVPLAGSLKTDYKLANDGTLTEASGELTNDTLKTILGALPISDLIKSGAGIGLTSKSVGGITVQLKAERRLLKITKSQLIPFEAGCPDKKSFEQSPDVGTLIEDVGADTPTPSTRADDNSITVSGKIVLPKASSSPTSSGAKPEGTTKDNTTAPPK